MSNVLRYCQVPAKLFRILLMVTFFNLYEILISVFRGKARTFQELGPPHGGVPDPASKHGSV